MQNFDKTSVSILTQVVFKAMYDKHVERAVSIECGTAGKLNIEFWNTVQENTLELARTIMRVDRQINPIKKE